MNCVHNINTIPGLATMTFRPPIYPSIYRRIFVCAIPNSHPQSPHIPCLRRHSAHTTTSTKLSARFYGSLVDSTNCVPMGAYALTKTTLKPLEGPQIGRRCGATTMCDSQCGPRDASFFTKLTGTVSESYTSPGKR